MGKPNGKFTKWTIILDAAFKIWNKYTEKHYGASLIEPTIEEMPYLRFEEILKV